MRDTRTLDGLVKKADSVVGTELEPVILVTERRTLGLGTVPDLMIS